MKRLFGSTLVAIVAVGATSYGYAKLTKKAGFICSQKYALCSAAQCIPDPNNSGSTTCFCDIYKGKNFGYSSCKERMPTTGQGEVEHVISTFSFANIETQKRMACPSGSPWSNCLDQPCIVDPLNPKKAICMCKVVKTGGFVTFGGNCDTTTCSSGFWSGATPQSNADAVRSMMQALSLKASPQKLCPKN